MLFHYLCLFSTISILFFVIDSICRERNQSCNNLFILKLNLISNSKLNHLLILLLTYLLGFKLKLMDSREEINPYIFLMQ